MQGAGKHLAASRSSSSHDSPSSSSAPLASLSSLAPPSSSLSTRDSSSLLASSALSSSASDAAPGANSSSPSSLSSCGGVEGGCGRFSAASWVARYHAFVPCYKVSLLVQALIRGTALHCKTPPAERRASPGQATNTPTPAPTMITTSHLPPPLNRSSLGPGTTTLRSPGSPRGRPGCSSGWCATAG